MKPLFGFLIVLFASCTGESGPTQGIVEFTMLELQSRKPEDQMAKPPEMRVPWPEGDAILFKWDRAAGISNPREAIISYRGIDPKSYSISEGANSLEIGPDVLGYYRRIPNFAPENVTVTFAENCFVRANGPVAIAGARYARLTLRFTPVGGE